MREILFRGKRKDNKEWVYGIPIVMHHNDERTHLYYFIIPDGSDLSFGVKVEDILVEIIPETRDQYTGLKDKNGRKIFEGDILRGKGKNVYEVVYPENIAGFVTRGTGVLSVPCMNYGTMKYYEIVGNIYDNPELLEVK